MSNAQRQRKRRASGPRPQLSVTVSRWVQAQLAAAAERLGYSLSEAVETACTTYASASGVLVRGPMRLTDKGAALLGKCATCGKALRSGDRVRRAGDFARHEGCPDPPK